MSKDTKQTKIRSRERTDFCLGRLNLVARIKCAENQILLKIQIVVIFGWNPLAI